MTLVDRINGRVANSVVGRWFRLDGSGHKKTRAGSYFCTELRAGLATFFAMAYIIAVNARYDTLYTKALKTDVNLMPVLLLIRAVHVCAMEELLTLYATIMRSIRCVQTRSSEI